MNDQKQNKFLFSLFPFHTRQIFLLCGQYGENLKYTEKKLNIKIHILNQHQFLKEKKSSPEHGIRSFTYFFKIFQKDPYFLLSLNFMKSSIKLTETQKFQSNLKHSIKINQKTIYNLTPIDQIILSRSEVKVVEYLNFLPGDLKEKIDPYLRSLYNTLYIMLPYEKIKTATFSFIRGCNLQNLLLL